MVQCHATVPATLLTVFYVKHTHTVILVAQYSPLSPCFNKQHGHKESANEMYCKILHNEILVIFIDAALALFKLLYILISNDA